MTTEINIQSVNKFKYISLNKNGGMDGVGTWEKIVDISIFKRMEYMLVSATTDAPISIHVSNDKITWTLLEIANIWIDPKVGTKELGQYKWLKLTAKTGVPRESYYCVGAVALFSGGGVVNRLLKKFLRHLRNEVCYEY